MTIHIYIYVRSRLTKGILKICPQLGETSIFAMDPVRTDLCEGVCAAVRATCTSVISVERDTKVAETGPMHTFTTRHIVVKLISVAVARGYGAEAGLKVGKLHR
jgi:hypothetical protein